MDDYARMLGYDPTQGPWILVVLPDGTTEFELFDDEAKMWCCDPDRIKATQARIFELKAKGLYLSFPDKVPLTIDPRDRSTWPALKKPPKPRAPKDPTDP